MTRSSALNTAIPMARFTMPHPGQRQILRHPARFKVVACGRRFGKTETGKIAAIETALRGGRVWWLAPTYQMAGQVWRDLKAALGPVRISETEHRLDFRSGGMIAVRSAHHPDYLRGDGLHLAILDEAAYMEPRIWPEIVRPMLATHGGRALFLSTPMGRNWFWDLFRLGVDPEVPDWGAFRYASHDNPLIPHSEFDAIRRTTPERIWRAEYLAEFVEDAGQVFRGIHEAATARLNALPVPGQRYVAGVDWGREHDYTAIAIIDTHTQQMVALDRFNRIGWEFQRGRLRALCERWRPAVIWAESNSIGAVNIEALQRDGLPVRPFATTARSKSPLIEGLSLAIERGELRLLPDPVLLGELASYTLERLPGGGFRYSAPAGGHDDTVIATALAWYGLRQGGLTLDFA